MSDDELRYVPCACGARIGVPYSAWQGRVDGHARGVADHLPECPPWVVITGNEADCICDRLRACETRVREDAHRYCFQRDAHEGYAAGLAAAREAVANAIPVWDQDGWNVCSHKDALAAIDGLKGESNG